MSDFVETEIGLLPETWPVQRLGDVFETQLGKMLSQKAHGGDAPKPYLRNKNVQWGSIDTSDMLKMDFSEREKAKFQLCPGDLLVCEGGVPGRAAIWNGAIEECYYQKALHRLRPRNGSMTNEFMLYWLYFSFDLQNLYGVAGASSTIAHLPETQLKALPIPVPPPAEQRKIAWVLGLVKLAIEQQERLIALTTELKTTLMHQVFTKGLRGEPRKQTEIGPLPQSWEIKRFDDFTTLQRGKDLTKIEFRDGVIPVAGSNGVIGFHETFNVPGPGVTVGRSGSVGRVVYYPSDFWAHNTALYVKNFHGNEPRFAAYYLEHQRLDRFRSGASVPTLDRNQFKDILIGVPERAEQTEIASVLETVERKQTGREGKHAALTALFRTLLHQLMTAQLRVHDLDLSEPYQEAKKEMPCGST
jgi:type I restriction enzyme, S subunit